MSVSIVIIALGCLIFLAHLFNALFERTKIPSVLILICIGIIVGPVMHWASPAFLGQFGSVFTTITLIVILFESGTGLSFSDIQKSIGSATALTIVNFIITVALSVGLLYFLTDMSILSCTFIGAAIGGTSSAVVIPIVKQLKLGEKTSATLYLESALSDVICLIVGLAVLESMQKGQISFAAIGVNMLMSMVIAAAFGVIFGVAWSLIQKRYLANIKNMMFASFALAFIIYGLCDLLHLNGGLAVLAFGIVLGNISEILKKYGKKKSFSAKFDLESNERSFFSEIGFVMQTYFFVYVGMSIKFGETKILVLGLIFTLLIFISRQFVAKFTISKTTDMFEKEMIAIMTPKGLIAAVLASLPFQMGLAYGEEIQGIAYSVVLFSIIICSILVARTKQQKKIFENTTNNITQH